MASFAETGPKHPITESTRVDKVTPSSRAWHNVRVVVVIALAVILLMPLVIMVVTAFKTRSDVVAVPPKIGFTPTMEGFVFLLTERALLNTNALAAARENTEDLNWMERTALASGQQVTGPSDYVRRIWNSVIIAGLSTLFSVTLGTFAAYAFSRFPLPAKNDVLFFILSTRMLPAVVVTIPLFLMYRQLGLHDTHVGMILLYTAFNLSLAVWLLKGFMDEIPREYEDAAMVDGYSRLQAFRKIVLPQAATGIAATTVFCLIFAWNEYAFSLMLTSDRARTAPPSIATMLGRGGIEWSAIAAGSLGFLIPVVIVTFVLRKYLLRGVTFGAIRQ